MTDHFMLQIKAALAEYDAALARREHGAVAAHKCVNAVRAALSSTPTPDYAAGYATTLGKLEDWKIDTSAGSPILTYQGCSVIQDEVAAVVLALVQATIRSLPVPAGPWLQPSSLVRETLADTANALAYVATALPNGTQRDAAEAAAAHAHDVLEADGMMDWLVGEVVKDVPPLPSPPTGEAPFA